MIGLEDLINVSTMGAHERMIILAVASAIIFFVLIFLLCKLCSGYLLQNDCPSLAKQQFDNDYFYSDKPYQKSGPTVHGVKNGKPPAQTSGKHSDSPKKRTSSRARSEPAHEPDSDPIATITASVSKLQSLQSTSSNASTLSVSSGPPESPKRTTSYCYGEESRTEPELHISLQYNGSDEKLSLYVNGARNLPPNIHGQPNDCILKIALVRNMKRGWVRRRSSISLEDITASTSQYDIVEMKTSPVRRSLNPLFNQYFTAELKEKDRKYATLKFALCHIDKWNRTYIAGECHHTIGRIDISQLTDIKLPLKQYRPFIGEIEIGLSYLPTAERVCLTILKATNLKLPKGCAQLLPNAYVKASTIFKGKQMAKQKTAMRIATASPEFQEALTFDVAVSELEKTTLVLTIAHQEDDDSASLKDDSGLETSTSTSASDDNRSPNMGKRRKSVGTLLDAPRSSADSGNLSKAKSADSMRSREVVIGRLALSASAAGTEHAHWWEMMKNPRTQITRWHNIIP
uniref:C2 domain-containing protein n=1 Tax=Plectus sambesii TaxID=2011161 RepID=A0A914W5Z4_9BILA